jgi:hypothetical protein
MEKRCGCAPRARTLTLSRSQKAALMIRAAAANAEARFPLLESPTTLTCSSGCVGKWWPEFGSGARPLTLHRNEKADPGLSGQLCPFYLDPFPSHPTPSPSGKKRRSSSGSPRQTSNAVSRMRSTCTVPKTSPRTTSLPATCPHRRATTRSCGPASKTARSMPPSPALVHFRMGRALTVSPARRHPLYRDTWTNSCGVRVASGRV